MQPGPSVQKSTVSQLSPKVLGQRPLVAGAVPGAVGERPLDGRSVASASPATGKYGDRVSRATAVGGGSLKIAAPVRLVWRARACRTGEEPGRSFRFKNLVEPPIALFVLLLCAPLLLVITLAIRLTSPGPIIYRRRVAGRYGREFDAFKFRTMVDGAEELLERDQALKDAFMVNYKLPKDPRVTPLGRFLRKYSLDELLQLWNVVRGEMWLIGPRMVTPSELDRYGDRQSKLMSVKPGLTGLWQVSGRQTISYRERVELDMHYIDHWSPWLDFSILVRTIGVVCRAEGAY